MSEVGDVIWPFGRPEEIVERELIVHPLTERPLYYAVRTEPLGNEDEHAPH